MKKSSRSTDAEAHSQSQDESGIGEIVKIGSDSEETEKTVEREPSLRASKEDRPPTPLWKRFRWKAWALKKGIIRRDEQMAKFRNTCALKPKTVLTSEYEQEMIRTSIEFEGEGTEFEEFEEGGEGAATAEPVVVDPVHLTVDYGITTTEETQPGTGTSDGKRASSKAAGSSNKKRSRSRSPTGSATGIDLKKQQKEGSIVQGKTARVGISSPSDKQNENELLLQIPQQHNIQERDESDPEANTDGLQNTSREESHSSGGKFWYQCANMNSDDLRKFCNLNSSETSIGSCYILRREPTLFPPVLDPVFQDIHSDLPKYPEFIKSYKQAKEGVVNSSNIQFERFKSYSVTDYHLNEKEGIDSGFYLFSDSWTDQELSITVEILKEEILKTCQEGSATSVHSEILPVPPPTPTSELADPGPITPETENADAEAEQAAAPLTNSLPNNLQLIVEYWNWRKDNCRGKTLISTAIDDYWITHVRLPPGRNTFRIWLLAENDAATATAADIDGTEELAGEDGIIGKTQASSNSRRSSPSISFIVKLIAQTPIYLGSRIEVQNYMTNEPVLLLRQAEILADSLWELFPCFTRKCHSYNEILGRIRRSYCPVCPEPKMINKFARGVHNTFESLFIALITRLNYASLDKMLIVTLRVLFINPMIGRNLVPPLYAKEYANATPTVTTVDRKSRSGLRKSKHFDTKHLEAAVIIQKYYRGWRVRRLFHMRRKSHKHFKMIQYNVWRIAFLLSNEIDCVFSQPEEKDGANAADSKEADVDDVLPPIPLPNPPRWSFLLLKKLLEIHPGLANVHSYANSTLQHIKIQEIEGELPYVKKQFSKLPFFTNVLMITSGPKPCFCEIDLQVYPPTGIYLKVKNNDTRKSLPLVNNRLFIGELEGNETGYTVQCYRWLLPDSQYDLTDRSPSNTWKIRLITPHSQNGPTFRKEAENFTMENSQSQRSSSIFDDVDDGGEPPIAQELLRCNNFEEDVNQ